MRIEHKGFIIASDGVGLTLLKKGVAGEKAKTPGAKTESVIGHFSTLEALCWRLIDVLADASEAKDIQDLADEIAQIKIDVLSICRAAGSTWKPLA